MKFPHKWLVCVIILLLMQIAAGFNEYKPVFQDDHYLMEGLFQVLETDLDQDGRPELIVSGKNYIGRELFVYWLDAAADFQPVIRWQSPNLFEERSILWIAGGQFSGEKNQLLALTETAGYLYEFSDGTLTLARQFAHQLQPLTVAAGDVDGDGRSELLIGTIGKITAKIYDGVVQVWRLGESGPELAAQTPGTVGNIRGMAAGDLDGDGLAEILVEEGLSTKPGRIHRFQFSENKLTERNVLKNPASGAIYGLKVKNTADGPRLATASHNGRLNLFALDQNGQWIVDGKERSFNCSFVDLDLADLNGDGSPELICAGYPQRLWILSK
jgi:hypothetical protein